MGIYFFNFVSCEPLSLESRCKKVGQLGLYDRLSQSIRFHLSIKSRFIKTDTITIF